MTQEEMQKQIESMMPTPKQIVENIDKKLEEKEVKLIQESTEDEHWQDVRERAAIAAMQGLLIDPSRVGNFNDYAVGAVACADALIEVLKKK